ncbi:hypothetical protein ACFPRL_26050 [Pseudoclavibacter helvolus]
MCTCLLPRNLKRIGTAGCIQTVLRPSPPALLSFQLKKNDSPRRSFVPIASWRCASRRSSKSTVTSEL